MKKTLLILLLVGSPLFAFARLGDTPDELVARYGRPVAKKPDGVYFRVGNCYLKAAPVEAKTDLLMYSWNSRELHDDDAAISKNIGELVAKNFGKEATAVMSQPVKTPDFLSKKDSAFSDGEIPTYSIVGKESPNKDGKLERPILGYLTVDRSDDSFVVKFHLMTKVGYERLEQEAEAIRQRRKARKEAENSHDTSAL